MKISELVIKHHMRKYEVINAKTAADFAFGESSVTYNGHAYFHNREEHLANNDSFLRKLIDQSSGSPNQEAFNREYAKQRKYQLYGIQSALKEGVYHYYARKYKPSGYAWLFNTICVVTFIVTTLVLLFHKN